MSAGPLPGEHVRVRPLIWLGAGLVLASIPLLWFLPPILPAWIALAAAWRISMAWRQRPLPSIMLRLAMFALGLGAVVLTHGTIFSIDAAISLLCVLAGLKVVELRNTRDYLVASFVGFFVMLSVLCYVQAFGVVVLLGIPALLLLAGMMEAVCNRTGGMPGWASLQVAVRLSLLALPLTLVFFLFFPRVNANFVVRFGQNRQGVTGMSDLLQPGSFERLALSENVAFRADFPEGGIPERRDRYWRGIVLTKCEGLVWRLGNRRPSPYRTREWDFDLVWQEITIEPHNQRWLFALDRPVRTPWEFAFFRDQTFEDARPIRRARRYRVGSSMETVQAQMGDREREANLAVDFEVDPRITGLAAQIRREAGDDPAKIAALGLAYFRDEFLYTMSPGFYAGADGMADFMFDRKKGFCEHFAASYATLMRLAGVPARVVLGYQGGEVNRHGGYVLVRQSEAHAWSEVWLDAGGWKRVDPTEVVAPDRLALGMEQFARASVRDPNADFNERQRYLEGGEGMLSDWLRGATDAWDNFNHQWNLIVVDYGGEEQSELLRALGAPEGREARWLWLALGSGLLVAALPTVWWAMRKPKSRGRIVHLAHAFENVLAKKSGPRARWESLTSYVGRLTPEFPADAAEAATAFAQLHAKIRYGPHAAGEHHGLTSALAQVRRAFAKMN